MMIAVEGYGDVRHTSSSCEPSRSAFRKAVDTRNVSRVSGDLRRIRTRGTRLWRTPQRRLHGPANIELSLLLLLLIAHHISSNVTSTLSEETGGERLRREYCVYETILRPTTQQAISIGPHESAVKSTNMMQQ